MKTMTAEELHSKLAQFSGSETIYKFQLAANMPHWAVKTPNFGKVRVCYTEGVKYLATYGECYWLLTEIATVLDKVAKREDCETFHIWLLQKYGDSGAVLKAVYDTDDEHMKLPAYEKKIPYTDFPFEGNQFKLYVGLSEDSSGPIYVIMLPRER